MVASPCVCACLLMVPRMKIRLDGEELDSLDLGFMKILRTLDAEMLWRVIGSFILCSRRFPMKVFQHDVLSNVAV